MADPVAEARALLAAATPGPWWPSSHNGDDHVDRGKVWTMIGPLPVRHVVLLRANDKIEGVDWRANAALAAAAPDLLARLCDEVERLRANAYPYPRIGSLWRHFRAGVCRVTSLREGDDGSVIVWYTEPDGAPWAQTLDQWHEHVERDGYSGPRFVEVAGG